MNDWPFTLIDVMRGIHNLSLYNKIPAVQFRFFIGLICKANNLGFKPVMEITNSEAMGLGAGNSRQSVNRIRKGLADFTVDGETLLTVTHGSHFKNISAKYEINYALLCRNGNLWVSSPSQKYDGSNDGNTYASQKYDGDGSEVLTDTVTDTVTTPRSEEKREDKNPHSITNIVPEVLQEISHSSKGGDGSKSEKEKARDRSKEVEALQNLIMETFEGQLTARPSYTACNSAIHAHGADILKAAAEEARGKALNSPTPHGALNYVIATAKRIKTPGVDYAQRNKVIMKLQDLKADMLKAEAETDLTKFEGVFVPTARGEVAVNTKEEFLEVKQGEVNRFNGMLGG